MSIVMFSFNQPIDQPTLSNNIQEMSRWSLLWLKYWLCKNVTWISVKNSVLMQKRMHFQLSKYWLQYVYVYKWYLQGMDNCDFKIWFDSIEQLMRYKGVNFTLISIKREVIWKIVTFGGALFHNASELMRHFFTFGAVFTFSSLIWFRCVSKAIQ